MSNFKPTSIKRAEGNAGHRPINRPPAIPTSIPAMPRGLPARARAEWRRITPILDSYKLITPLDAGVVGDYCLCIARLAEAESDITARGLLIGGKRDKVKNPSAQLARQYRQALGKYAELLGLAPAPRGRMDVDTVKSDVDELKFLLHTPRMDTAERVQRFSDQFGGHKPGSSEYQRLWSENYRKNVAAGRANPGLFHSDEPQ